MNAPTSAEAVVASTSIVVSLRDVSLFYGKTRALDAVSFGHSGRLHGRADRA